MKNALLMLSCVFLFLGCAKDQKTLQFARFSIEKVDDQDCDPDKENCAYISLNIPQAEGTDEIESKINKEIKKQLIDLIDYKEEKKYKSLAEFSEDFIEDYRRTKKEFPEEKTPWEAQVDGKILYKSKNLICIQLNLQLFTGGAHGHSSTSYLNINPETGNTYGKSDLFTPDFKDFAEELFRKNYKIPKTENINSSGFFFENEVFQLPENIGFTKDYLILLYNPYEITAYSEGNVELKIPRDQVETFVKFD